MECRWTMLNRFNKFTRDPCELVLLPLMPLDIKKDGRIFQIRNWHILCTTIHDVGGRILPATENRNVGLRFRFSFSASIRLSTFAGERINSIDFSYDLLSQKGKEIFFDEGKVWKVFQSIFSSDNDDDENKRKVDEKFIVNCGACWGLMWVWFPVRCLDVKCRVLIIFLIYSKTFVRVLWPPTVLLQPSCESAPMMKMFQSLNKKFVSNFWVDTAKQNRLKFSQKLFPDLFFVSNFEEKISISLRGRIKLPALETWIITTLRALFTYLLAV